MTRRDFIGLGVGGMVMPVLGKPIRGAVGGRETGLSTGGGGGEPTAADYVQDGLIAMWDGIENAGWGVHDSNATAWKDLCGTRNLVLSGATIGDTHTTFESSSYAYSQSAFQSSDLASLEVVMEVRTATSAPCFMSFFDRNGYVGDMLWYSKGCVAFGVSKSVAVVTSECAMAGTATWGLSSRSFVRPNMPYLNGVSVAAHTTTDYYANRRGFPMAINPTTNWTFGGDIYSIRVYSRALANDEVAANYAIDKERFGLP